MEWSTPVERMAKEQDWWKRECSYGVNMAPGNGQRTCAMRDRSSLLVTVLSQSWFFYTISRLDGEPPKTRRVWEGWTAHPSTRPQFCQCSLCTDEHRARCFKDEEIKSFLRSTVIQVLFVMSLLDIDESVFSFFIFAPLRHPSCSPLSPSCHRAENPLRLCSGESLAEWPTCSHLERWHTQQRIL